MPLNCTRITIEKIRFIISFQKKKSMIKNTTIEFKLNIF